MKYIKMLFMMLICACFLSGCGIDTDQYILSSLNVICRSDYAEYSKLTGKSSSDLAEEQNMFLTAQADRLIQALGGEGCSADMRKRYVDFIKMLYADARYEIKVKNNKKNESDLIIYPITLLTAQTDELKTYTEKFQAANEEFAYSSLSSEDYIDTYLDGMLSVLGAHLSEIEYDSPQSYTLTVEKDENGLYTIEPGTLSSILEIMLPVPG